MLIYRVPEFLGDWLYTGQVQDLLHQCNNLNCTTTIYLKQGKMALSLFFLPLFFSLSLNITIDQCVYITVIMGFIGGGYVTIWLRICCVWVWINGIGCRLCVSEIVVASGSVARITERGGVVWNSREWGGKGRRCGWCRLVRAQAMENLLEWSPAHSRI